MLSSFKSGFAVISLLSLLGAMPVSAQGISAPSGDNAPSDPEQAPEMTDADIMNVTLVCIATYDAVLAEADVRSAPAAKEARQLARDVYKNTSQQDDTAINEAIAKIDAAMTDEIKSGGVNLRVFRQTCDRMFIQEPSASPAA